MNNKIDINNLSWVATNVVKPLDEMTDELMSVNKLLKEFEDYLEYVGLENEMKFSFQDQSEKINNIKKDIDIIHTATIAQAELEPSMRNSCKYEVSIENIVDSYIDQPFFRKMEKTVASLSNKNISNYTVKNSYGITVVGETYSKKKSVNDIPEGTFTEYTSKTLNIKDLLSSPFSKAMRETRYRQFVKKLNPSFTDEDIDRVDCKWLYDLFLKTQLDLADFDYTTELEEAMNTLRLIGVVLGCATTVVAMSPAVAAWLGTGAMTITVSSATVNGFLSTVDVLMLITNKNINGDELFEYERNELLQNVAIDGAFLSMSMYSKIHLKNASNIVVEGASGADDFLSGMNAEDAKRYLEWNDLVTKGFTAEERYNLSKFGSIKTQLDYTTSTGLKLQGTTGKTTTILGNYNEDMGHIVNELGNIKSTDFGPKNGGFNVLNVPDEEFSRLGREGFWKKYNEPWLKSAIDRNDIIKVATYPDDSVRYWFDADGVRQLTGYGRELKMLEDAGYVYDSFMQSFVK